MTRQDKTMFYLESYTVLCISTWIYISWQFLPCFSSDRKNSNKNILKSRTHYIGSLGKGVFERRTSTGSEIFFILNHLDQARRKKGGWGGSRGWNEAPLQVIDGWLKTQAVNFQLLANSSQTPPTRLLALPNLYFFLTKNFGKNIAEEWRSPLPASWRREFFISRRRQPQKTSLEKWICVLSISIAITPNHLLCQMQANPFWAEFLRTILSLERERKFSRCLFTSMIKREIRHFPVVVVQWRQRNVQKSVVLTIQPIAFLTFSLWSPSWHLKVPI